MNGVHDMGGMQGYGPIPIEQDEPLFHADWEKKVFAVTLAMGVGGKWNIDMARAARESIAPARYVSSSYYEIWFEGLLKLMLEAGLISRDELQEGAPSAPRSADFRVLKQDQIDALFFKGWPSHRTVEDKPRYAVGDQVRTRAMSPRHHTRLPAYCRDKTGVIVLAHGAHVFPDRQSQRLGEAPQWLYTVRFDAKAIWGEDSSAGFIHVDCWESYLVPALS
jgi:nitrile hydratase beta subunit